MASKSKEVEYQGFEHRGIWWIPGNSRKKIAGTLSYNIEDGIRLELMEPFAEMASILQTKTISEYAIILGRAENGDKITLHQCNGDGDVRARTAFVGAHFRIPSHIQLNELSVSFLHLCEWADMSRIKVEKPNPKALVFTHTMPDTFQIALAGTPDTIVRLEPGLIWNISRDEASLRVASTVTIRPPKPQAFSRYDDVLFGLQNFLSLATGHPVVPLAIHGDTNIGKYERDGRTYFPTVHAYFSPVHPPRNPKRLYDFEMLFTLKDIGDRLEVFVNTWFSKSEQLKPVYDLYFGALRNVELYSDTRFLFMVQALESYSRRTMPNKELPEEQHRERVRAILEAVPTEHKRWLEGKLTYSNEPNLRKRLRNVFALFPETTIAPLGDPKSFIERVVTIRNYLTHYYPSFKGRIPTGEEYHRAALKLRYLLEVCLLKEIGFADAELANLAQRSMRSNRYAFLRNISANTDDNAR